MKMSGVAGPLAACFWRGRAGWLAYGATVRDRGALIAQKQRKLELRAGAPSARGRKGRAAFDSLAAVRAAERDLAAQSEAAYRTMVAAWQPTRPPARPEGRKAAGAAASTRTRLTKPAG
jgi:hypothetical protein